MIVKNCKLDKPIWCHENDSIISIARNMEQSRLRNIVVVNDSISPVGIISSVDMVNKIIARDISYKDLCAKEIMAFPVFYVNDEDLVSKAYFNMIKFNTYSLPVVNKEKRFAGVLSFTEAVKHLSKKIIQEKVTA